MRGVQQAQSAFHVRLPWKYPARDISADMIEKPLVASTPNLTLETLDSCFLHFLARDICAGLGWLKTPE
jgi:hypothetical protein